jgi:hypothetical protein
MSTSAAVLLVVGASMELAGIVLVGSPDLFPQAQRVSEWLRLRGQRIYERVRRVLGRPVHQTVTGSAGLATAVGLSGRGIVSVAADASLEDKVAFLLRRDEQTQGRLADLAESVSALRDETATTLSQERTRMEMHVAHSLREAHEAYLPLRLLGVLLLTLGLGCTTAANFLA